MDGLLQYLQVREHYHSQLDELVWLNFENIKAPGVVLP
jgi:hypothetical protein